MEYFGFRAKQYGLGAYVETIRVEDRSEIFDQELWYDLGKSMWRKQRITLHYHVKYIQNDIQVPLRVIILQYSDRPPGMYDLYKYLPPPSKKGNVYHMSQNGTEITAIYRLY